MSVVDKIVEEMQPLWNAAGKRSRPRFVDMWSSILRADWQPEIKAARIRDTIVAEVGEHYRTELVRVTAHWPELIAGREPVAARPEAPPPSRSPQAPAATLPEPEPVEAMMPPAPDSGVDPPSPPQEEAPPLPRARSRRMQGR